MRVGIGYDVHRFRVRGGTLTLGGVAIPSARGLDGHSDADVLLHALTDALLGAIAGPDLGELFPSTDPRWRNADSRQFVAHALALVRKAGWRVRNVDAVLLVDAPRFAPHKPAVRQSMSRILRLDPGAVSVKAKSTEGFAPEAKGIVAQVVVLLERARRRTAS